MQIFRPKWKNIICDKNPNFQGRKQNFRYPHIGESIRHLFCVKNIDRRGSDGLLGTKKYIFDLTYPSRRHNLTPTLAIIIRNFPKFSKIFEIFPKISQNFPKFSKFPKFSQNFHYLGVYNIKHNLARSGFQFWLSKSAPRVTKLKTWSRQIMFFFVKKHDLMKKHKNRQKKVSAITVVEASSDSCINHRNEEDSNW